MYFLAKNVFPRISSILLGKTESKDVMPLTWDDFSVIKDVSEINIDSKKEEEHFWCFFVESNDDFK